MIMEHKKEMLESEPVTLQKSIYINCKDQNKI